MRGVLTRRARSNLTRWKAAVDFQAPSTGLGDYSGRYIRYGVREHGMGAIMNGLAAYGPNLVIPAAGAFRSLATGGTELTRTQELSSTLFRTPLEPSALPRSPTSASSGLPYVRLLLVV